ncbi:HNH endonuclease [Pseudolysinimonas kribbensis]|uniref:HNH endonuclease n=1 Tax=Pseudolysinimonas kribbensis TaxID=433641 RepID=UPI003CD060C8
MTIDPSLKVPNKLAATVDHLLPRSMGGTDDPSNLATAHLSCNSSRGASLTW